MRELKSRVLAEVLADGKVAKEFGGAFRGIVGREPTSAEIEESFSIIADRVFGSLVAGMQLAISDVACRIIEIGEAEEDEADDQKED